MVVFLQRDHQDQALTLWEVCLPHFNFSQSFSQNIKSRKTIYSIIAPAFKVDNTLINNPQLPALVRIYHTNIPFSYKPCNQGGWKYYDLILFFIWTLDKRRQPSTFAKWMKGPSRELSLYQHAAERKVKLLSSKEIGEAQGLEKIRRKFWNEKAEELC